MRSISAIIVTGALSCVVGCAHAPRNGLTNSRPVVGRSERAYHGLPYYLTASPKPSAGPRAEAEEATAPSTGAPDVSLPPRDLSLAPPLPAIDEQRGSTRLPPTIEQIEEASRRRAHKPRGNGLTTASAGGGPTRQPNIDATIDDGRDNGLTIAARADLPANAIERTAGRDVLSREQLPVVGERPLPRGEQLARLRALLAAVDAHAAAIGEGARLERGDVRALELTVDEMARLLEPYPDIEYEVAELRALVDELPSTAPLRLGAVRARMGELTDLIRLQLLAGS